MLDSSIASHLHTCTVVCARVYDSSMKRARKKEQERKKIKVQVSTTLQAPFSKPRSGNSSYSQKGKPRLAREIQNDKVKFLLLCLVFAVIIVMLWRAIPS